MILRCQLILGLLSIALVSASPRKEKDPIQVTNKCPMLTECPYNAEKCMEDDDCSVDAVCCKSPCGKVCTKQLFTGCQTLRMAASRRAKSLGVETKSVRMPRCNKQGSFEPIQCDNEIVSSCWCVDESGFELPGTRAPAAALVNCTAPKACADATCRMFCPYGFALDKQGCPLCKCREPCDDIRCPNQLQCHLEDLACADPPCPPVPTCKKGRSLENVCPVGDPLRISDTVRPFLCGNNPGTPSCPPMYQCLVQKGSEYGACCPASLKIQKTGTCPLPSETNLQCGNLCTHDLECPSVQKCCQTESCGSSCIHPKNVTECFHQRALSEVLAVSERAGRGYVPQCTKDGQFELKQCSRNGLVCWCVDRMGRKLKGSMGPSDNVECSHMEVFRDQSVARSLDKKGKECERLECAAICEYGFKLGDDGCHTCNCDDPCDGYMCPEDEECVNVKESTCTDSFLCPSLPVCRPKAVYANPCVAGTPLTDDLSGAPVACALRSEDGTVCPENYECTAVPGSTQAVCCPFEETDEYEGEASEDYTVEARPQSMCEYLHEFSETMEGTKEGMTLALPSPECDKEGNYLPTQCDRKSEECWCVDNFGTELPNSRSANNETDCLQLRKSMDCPEATCRMGCEYGFVLSEETGCPTCQCRDPCYGVNCKDDEQCQMVEVSCKDHYCPPVPACLPKKTGQCPYLVPATSTTCNFECNSDLTCNGTMRCCSNGCGTQCVEPLLYTACQHQRTLAQHQAHEEGIPVGKVYMPECKPDGSYNPKQCHPSKNECWCVDDRGFEISKTRTVKGDQLNCDVQPKNAECPLYKCQQDCEHGFEIDDDGCRTCRCVDPCDKIACRGDGESCRLVQVECISWPCPPVPMCLPRKENPCQNGEPLKLGSNSDELVTCGPEFEGCPSSHKCQLSPVGEYAVCCPKPRDVCFEPLESGSCEDQESLKNTTRYYFNSTSNKCESFSYSGCQGNHNNFHSKATCDTVCPVLSQCERLREKNQRQSAKYDKPTFAPRCDPDTGAWQAIQCMEHVGVCWCVTPTGEPLKGTITRGDEPVCNFRQARIWASDRSDDSYDLVLEQLLMQIETHTTENKDPSKEDSTVSDLTNLPSKTRCQALGGVCDEGGRFLPTQCEEETCWCVDEAGNQLVGTNTFVKGERTCYTVPIETAEVTLGFHGHFDAISSIPVVNQVTKIVQALDGNIGDQGIATEIDDDVLLIKFGLIGSNKVDVAYRLERMVMQQMIPGLTADMTRSRVLHKLLPQDINASESLTFEQREIVSQAPVSVVAPYHTALIVIAAASAFVISVLTVLIILYRRKMHSMTNQKVIDDGRFLANRPIYIELPSDKNSINAVPSPVETMKNC